MADSRFPVCTVQGNNHLKLITEAALGLTLLMCIVVRLMELDDTVQDTFMSKNAVGPNLLPQAIIECRVHVHIIASGKSPNWSFKVITYRSRGWVVVHRIGV